MGDNLGSWRRAMAVGPRPYFDPFGYSHSNALLDSWIYTAMILHLGETSASSPELEMDYLEYSTPLPDEQQRVLLVTN